MSHKTNSVKDSEVANLSKRKTKTKQKKRPPDFSNPDTLVRFIIGAEPNTRSFAVHKEFACYASEVLDFAFHSQFTEGLTQTYRLDDVTESAFRLFVQYIYHQKLVLKQLGPHCDHDDEDGQYHIEDIALVDLWVLGDKFRMPGLQNLVIESMTLIAEASTASPVSYFKDIYQKTAVDSALRQFAVAMTVVKIPAEDLARYQKDFPRLMLVDVAVSLMQRADAGRAVLERLDYKKYYVPLTED